MSEQKSAVEQAYEAGQKVGSQETFMDRVIKEVLRPVTGFVDPDTETSKAFDKGLENGRNNKPR